MVCVLLVFAGEEGTSMASINKIRKNVPSQAFFTSATGLGVRPFTARPLRCGTIPI